MRNLWQVNGNLVSPTHALANAEVVEILTYDVRAFLLYCFSYTLAMLSSSMLFKSVLQTSIFFVHVQLYP